MVVWLIGLSGAGKTSLGKRVVELRRKQGKTAFFLDGDNFRKVMGDDLGHSLEERHANAWRMCRFCQELELQGIDVVCAILSLFPDTRQWNREKLEQYTEVYLRVPIEELTRRDSKGLYKGAAMGTIQNVAGIDIPFPEPDAHFVFDNIGPKSSLDEYAQVIVNAME